MDSESALISCFQAVDDEFCHDYLKFAFLWNEEILFEELNTFDTQKFLNRLTKQEELSVEERSSLSDVIIPISTYLGKDILEERLQNQFKRGYPRWGKNHENYNYPEPKTPFEYAHNALLRNIEQEKGVEQFEGIDIEYAEGRARVSVDIVELWSLINSTRSTTLLASRDEELALSSACSFSHKESQKTSGIELLVANVPSLTNVTWKKIISLKSRGTFKPLKFKIEELHQKGNIDKNISQNLLSLDENSVIEELIEEYRPKIIKTSIKNISSNIPGLPINPVGVYYGLKEIWEESKKAEDLAWFYALRDLRKLTSE